MKFFPKIIPWRFRIFLAAILVISFFSYFRILNNYELISYDLRLRLRPPLKTSPDIILIEISDDTLKNLGNWPLPRDFHASLIDVLNWSGAKTIVFDILFSEPTIYDEIFSQGIKGAGNVYLPIAFYLKEPLHKNYLIPPSSEILGGLCPTLEIHTAGKGQINVFVDPDGKIRKIPLFIQYNHTLFPNLGLRAACAWQGLDIRNVEFKKNKLIIDHKLSLPVSFNTAFMVNYPDKWQKAFKHLSYFQILKAYSDIKKGIKPEVDLSILKGKACFIGLTATGTSDLRATPLENVYPMLGLQASIFNSILEQKFISDAGPSLNTLINIIIFLISFIICLKFNPLKAFLGNIILAGGYFLISTGAMIFYGLWIDLFFPLFIIALTYIGALVYRFLDELRKRQLLEKELDIARTIQKSFLPQDIREFSGLDISCFMQPAKFVAGDLYDIISVDDKRLGVCIGDVSGKGVPASLIMAQTISLFRIFSRQYLNCPEVLVQINKELCGKFEGRFVTSLYMIVDTENNNIRVCSAGQAPLLLYRKRENKILEVDLSLEVPLGVMEEVGYKEVVFDIEAGDKVIIFTDGLSEARNKRGEEFGLDNIKKTILINANSSPQVILDSLKENLFRFSHSCPQHDDITLIILGKPYD